MGVFVFEVGQKFCAGNALGLTGSQQGRFLSLAGSERRSN